MKKMIVRKNADIVELPRLARKVHVVHYLSLNTAKLLVKHCPHLRIVILTRTAKKNASKKAINYLLQRKIDIIQDYSRQGRPVKFSRRAVVKMINMRKKNFSYRKIAVAIGVSLPSVMRVLRGLTKFTRWEEDYKSENAKVVWMEVRDGNPYARRLADNHYSRKTKGAKLFCGPGEKLVLMTPDNRALFAWRKNKIRWDGQDGVECTLFRNEGSHLSSDLIKEAVKLARKRWPKQHFFTYVWPSALKSTNPGFCFIRAGWKVIGRNSPSGRRKLLLLEAPKWKS